MELNIKGKALELLIDKMENSKKMRHIYGSMSWQSDQANDMLALTIEVILDNSKINSDKTD